MLQLIRAMVLNTTAWTYKKQLLFSLVSSNLIMLECGQPAVARIGRSQAYIFHDTLID